MKTIKRHELDTEHFTGVLEHECEMMEIGLAYPVTGIPTVTDVGGNAGKLALLRSVVEVDWPDVVEHLQIEAQAMAAALDLADSTEGEVQVELPGFEPATLERVGPHNLVDNGEWESAFWAAVICRDGESLQTVCDTSTQTLRDALDLTPGSKDLGPHGIDGVYYREKPPPQWVDQRLEQAVGEPQVHRIRLDGYVRWELRVDSSGDVDKRVVPTVDE